METLFIDRKGARLSVDAGRLIIRLADEARPTSLPLKQIALVAVSAQVEFSSSLLLALGREGITMICLNPRKSQEWVFCNGFRHGAAGRRLAQFEIQQNGAVRLDLARLVVKAKLLAHYRALCRHQARRKDCRYALVKAKKQLRECWKAVSVTQSIESLRGHEGAAAAAYFSALSSVITGGFEFTGRRRRPPPDPVNALMSLSYTLVHGEALRALISSGLDPVFGYLHEVSYGRDSLACDFVEPLRAEIDTWLLDLLRDGGLRKTHFQELPSGACMLSKEGRKLYFPLFQYKNRRWRKRLRLSAQQLARYLDGYPALANATDNKEVEDGSSLFDD